MDNREIICIHIGQAGIQIGSAIWELFTIEHELDENGQQICFCPWPLQDNTNSLFFEVGKCKFKPRCLMVDSESLVVDEIRTGIWRNIFESKGLITGKEDAATIFGRGYSLCANDVLDQSLSYLRGLLEGTNFLNGFLIFHSLGGGTGSGLTCRITEVLRTEAPRKPMIHVPIVPPTSKYGFIVEPYNGVLSTAALLESSSLMCMMENEALYKIAEGITQNSECLGYHNINRHIAQITSSLTTSYRFSNKLSSDFSVFQTNLVPFPGIHFPIVSYMQSDTISDANLFQITKDCFTENKMTVKLDPDLGSYMSCCLLYRGMHCRPLTINGAIRTVKSDPKIKFVDWCPTGFKVAINIQMPGSFPLTNIPETKRSLCLLSNSTAIIQVWSKLLTKFQNLISRKAYLHWFAAEGIEEDVFKNAEQRIQEIISKYKDLETNSSAALVNVDTPKKRIPSVSNQKNAILPPKSQIPTIKTTVEPSVNTNRKSTSTSTNTMTSSGTTYLDTISTSTPEKAPLLKKPLTGQAINSNYMPTATSQNTDSTTGTTTGTSTETTTGTSSGTTTSTTTGTTTGSTETTQTSEKKSKNQTKSNSKPFQSFRPSISSGEDWDFVDSVDTSKESITQTGSLDQYNLSSKYKRVNIKRARFRRQPSAGLDSMTDSLFFKCTDDTRGSSDTLVKGQNSILSISSKTSSFSAFLHNNILTLPHFERIPNPKDSLKMKPFLAKFCRLNSKINLSKSQDSFCNKADHVNNLSCPIDRIQYFPVRYGKLQSKSQDFENVHFFDGDNYDIPEMKVRPVSISDIGRVRLHDTVITRSNIEICNFVSSKKGVENGCQTTGKASLRVRLSRIYSQLSIVKEPKNLKTTKSVCRLTKPYLFKRFLIRKFQKSKFSDEKPLNKSCTTHSFMDLQVN